MKICHWKIRPKNQQNSTEFFAVFNEKNVLLIFSIIWQVFYEFFETDIKFSLLALYNFLKFQKTLEY
jgi:hypothetical protein